MLISLDTTRADRLGCYGYDRDATPNLDAIAQRGVQFDHAFAHVPITLPSHICLLTGTYPPEHGVRVNGKQALGPTLQTLAEIYKQHGYKTAAFIASAVLDARYGLDRGFDIYDDEIGSHESQPMGQRPAGEVCNRVLQWLDTNAARETPLMCFVHFYDAHTPYTAPQEFVDKMGDPYDAEVAYMDAQIGRLIDWLKARSLLEKTLLVVVADHGESLGEHGYEWHSLLVYHSIVRIPLLISLPERLPENQRVAGVTRMVDVMPTMLDLMGWESPDQVGGRSLSPVFAGGTLVPQLCYGETEYPLDSFGWSNLRFLINENWKYIRAPEPELYDLTSDPGEMNNLADTNSDRIARMESALSEIERDMKPHDAAEVSLSAEELRELSALGYVGSARPTDVGDVSQRKNPKGMGDVVHAFRRAEALYGEHRAIEAIETLEPLIERSPESFVIVELLAKAYAGAGALECAHGLLLEALALQPKSSNTWILLARVCHARGATARAIEACGRALESQPNHEEAKHLLPALQQALDRQKTKLTELRRRFQQQPESVDICLSLALALLSADQAAEAFGVLRDGLGENHNDTRLANELAWQLATSPEDELRNGAEAVRLARMACRGDNESIPDFLDTLGAALAEAERFDEAAEVARRASHLAKQAGQHTLNAVIARRLKLYEAKHPYRSPP